MTVPQSSSGNGTAPIGAKQTFLFENGCEGLDRAIGERCVFSMAFSIRHGRAFDPAIQEVMKSGVPLLFALALDGRVLALLAATPLHA
jgi:hypothetical protein